MQTLYQIQYYGDPEVDVEGYVKVNLLFFMETSMLYFRNDNRGKFRIHSYK